MILYVALLNRCPSVMDLERRTVLVASTFCSKRSCRSRARSCLRRRPL